MGFFPQTSFRFLFFFQPSFFLFGILRCQVLCRLIFVFCFGKKNYEATWLRAHSPPQRPTALSLPSPFALWPLFCPTNIYIYIQRETYDDASRHVSIHHRAHRGTPGHETAVEEPQKRVFGYRSRARVYRDG